MPRATRKTVRDAVARIAPREQAYVDTVVAAYRYNRSLGCRESTCCGASRYYAVIGAAGRREAGPIFATCPSPQRSTWCCAHTLEFSAHPHQSARVARVLMPEALSSSPCQSLAPVGVRAVPRRSGYPWKGRFINLPRMKDWLALLGLELVGGQMTCYVPPCKTQKWLERVAFMDAAGDRWWPIAGGVYFLQAVKRVHGLRIIMPKWSDVLATSKALAPAPKKVRQPEDAVTARHDKA